MREGALCEEFRALAGFIFRIANAKRGGRSLPVFCLQPELLGQADQVIDCCLDFAIRQIGCAALRWHGAFAGDC